MTLRDYVFGRKFRLFSPLPLEEVQGRINAASASIFWPFAHGVAGWSRLGRLSLSWRTPLLNNGFAPAFRGRLHNQLGATEIEASYGFTLYQRVFYSVWYGLLILMLVTLLIGVAHDGTKTGNEWAFFVVVPVFAVVPVLFTVIFNWNAEAHLEEILDFLEREVGARARG